VWEGREFIEFSIMVRASSLPHFRPFLNLVKGVAIVHPKTNHHYENNPAQMMSLAMDVY